MQLVTIHYEQSIIIYVSEHQLPHAVDTSNTAPIARVNQGRKLLKLIS